jgi:hypothetical protein
MTVDDFNGGSLPASERDVIQEKYVLHIPSLQTLLMNVLTELVV